MHGTKLERTAKASIQMLFSVKKRSSGCRFVRNEQDDDGLMSRGVIAE